MIWWLIIQALIISVSLIGWFRFLYLRSLRNTENAERFINAALQALFYMPVFLTAFVVINTAISGWYFTIISLKDFLESLISGSKQLHWDQLQNLHVITAGLLLTIVGSALAANSLPPWRQRFWFLSLAVYAVFTLVSVVFFISCLPVFFNPMFKIEVLSVTSIQRLIYGLLVIFSIAGFWALKNYPAVRFIKLSLTGLFFYVALSLIPSVGLMFKWGPIRNAMHFLLDNKIAEGIYTGGIYAVCYGSFLFFHVCLARQVVKLESILLRAVILILQAVLLAITVVLMLQLKPVLFDLIPYLVLNIFVLYLLSIVVALVKKEPSPAP